jgi:hypothetical protein
MDFMVDNRAKNLPLDAIYDILSQFIWYLNDNSDAIIKSNS